MITITDSALLLCLHGFFFFFVGDIYIYIFFEREFQPMVSVSDYSYLSSNQDTNQFLGDISIVITGEERFEP